MTPETVTQVMNHALELILLLLSVVLVPALAVGVLVSMFQAATQINEMTLSFVPKLLVTVFALVVGGPWMMHLLIDYTRRLITGIPALLG